MLHQALLSQQSQGFTQRSPADTEVGAELLFDDLVAGRELAGQDRIAQSVAGHFDESRGQHKPSGFFRRRGHGTQW